LEQDARGIRGQIDFEKRRTHQLHPAITSGLIDHKGRVAHAQARMAARFDVSLRTAEAIDEKAAEALFSGGEIAATIHRTEDVVIRDLLIEGGDEPLESFVADGGVDFVFFHGLFVLRTEAEADQHRCADFSIIGQLLVGLELFHGTYRIVAPLAIDFAFEITFLRKRLLDFFVALRIGMYLVGRSALGASDFAASGGLLMSRLGRRGGREQRGKKHQGARPSHPLQSICRI